MTHWTQRDMIGFDVESTSPHPLTARMVQAALLRITPHGEEADALYGLIDPGCEVPAEAAKVHGITTAKAKQGTPIRQAIGKMVLKFDMAEKFGIPVVIFNAGYDWPLFRAECQRTGIEVVPQPFILDPLVIDRKMDKYRRGKRTLETMAAHYGIELSDAHDARADVRATVGVMRALIHKFPALSEVGLQEMSTLQRAWYGEWRDGINQHWASKGETKRVEGEWLWPKEGT